MTILRVRRPVGIAAALALLATSLVTIAATIAALTVKAPPAHADLLALSHQTFVTDPAGLVACKYIFNVPYEHVRRVQVEAVGGKGHQGSGTGGDGGRGGKVSGVFAVSGGETLYVQVAGNGGVPFGHTPIAGGLGGGGDAHFDTGDYAGTGGGASFVARRRCPTNNADGVPDPTTTEFLMVAAGGGGGGGGDFVNAGGGGEAGMKGWPGGGNGRQDARGGDPGTLSGPGAGGAGGMVFVSDGGGPIAYFCAKDAADGRPGGAGNGMNGATGGNGGGVTVEGVDDFGGAGGGGYYGGGSGGGRANCDDSEPGGGGGGASYIDPNATDSNVAIAEGGEQPYVRVTTLVSPPDPPGISVSPGLFKATLSITAPEELWSSGLTGYRATVNPGNRQFELTPEQTSLTIPDLDAKVTHTVSVVALSNAGDGLAATTTVTPFGRLPNAPPKPNAVSNSSAHLTVSWDPPSGETLNLAILDYLVQCNDASGGGTSTSSPLTFEWPNEYAATCTVRARNSLGYSGPSPPSNAVTAHATAAPAKPTNVVATRRNNGALVSFKVPDFSASSYLVTATPGPATVTLAGPLLTDLRAVVTGLTNGTSYTFTVTATNPLGSAVSDPSNAIIPGASVPDRPSMLSATPGDRSIDVAFLAPADDGGSDITSYQFSALRSTAGGSVDLGACFVNGAAPACSGPDASGIYHLTLSGLTNGTRYDLRMVARNAIGGSEVEFGDSATPSAPPGAPTGVSATQTSGTATVRFTPPAANGGTVIDTYTVTRNPGGTATCQVPNTFGGGFAPDCVAAGGGAFETTLSGVPTFVTNTFTVHGTNQAGDGAESAAATSTFPLPPTSVTAAAGNSAATVSFVDSPQTGLQHYLVTATPSILGPPATGTSSPITVIGLTNGTGYTFTVAAVYSGGTTPPSAPSNSVTPQAQVPGAPTAVSVQPEGGAARVSFNAPFDDGGSAITGFEVASESGAETGAGTASPVTVTGLTNGTPYRFKVRATNAVGAGAYSALSDPVTPNVAVVTISAIDDQAVTIGPGASTGSIPFSIECATCGSSANTNSASAAQVSVRSSNTLLVPTANVFVNPGTGGTPQHSPRSVEVVPTAGNEGRATITLTATLQRCAPACTDAGSASEDFTVTVSRPKETAPTVTGPIAFGATTVSGTSTAGSGGSIHLYVNGAPTNVFAPVLGGAWTASTPTPAPAVGDAVTATAFSDAYSESDPSPAVIVTQGTPTIAWAKPNPITYGTALGGRQLNATSPVGGTFAYSPAAGTVLDVGPDQDLSVTFTPTDTASYTAATKTVKISVYPATPTIAWANPPDVVHGTALDASQLNAVASVDGSSVPGTFTYDPPAGTVLDAGPSQILSVGFTPTDAAKYSSTAATTHINVSAVPTTIEWADPADISYGTALGATQLNATASANGAPVPGSFTYSPPAGTQLPVGNNQALRVNFVPNDHNYAAGEVTVHINVTRATPTINWDDPPDITYGSALSALQLRATATSTGSPVAGSFLYTPPAGVVLPAGLQRPLGVKFTPADGTAYDEVSKTVRVNVTPARLTVTPDAQSMHPGEPDPTFTFKITGFVNGDDENALSAPPDCGVAAPHGTKGQYTITCSGGTARDYTFDTTATATLTVATPATITWDNPIDIVFGTALGATQLDATATDNGNPVPGTFAYSPPAGEVLNAGPAQDLSVTFTPTDTTNYTAASKTVKINVTKSPTTITWDNPADIVYGTALGGTQLNPQPSIPGTFTFTPPIGKVLDAGPNQDLTADFVPTDSANYQPSSKTVQINVTQAPSTITWSNPADIVFGTALGATQLNATASVPGTFVYTPPAGEVLNAGPAQDLSVIFTPTDGNHATATKTVKIDVTKLPTTITWSNPADIVYGTALSGTQLNPQPSIPGTFTFTPPIGTVLNAGSAQNLIADFVPTDSANYQPSSKTVQITVTQAPSTITWANPDDIVFGTALSGTQLHATASVPGTFAYTPASGTALGAGAGQNLKVDFTPTDSANYQPSSKTVQINVTKAPSTITWANPADIVHGTALSGTQLNATASVPGTFAYTPASGTVLGAGAGQNLKVDFTPTDSANYQPSSKTVQINVTQAPTTITWSNPADMVYGTALGATQLNAAASVPGTFVYTPASGTVPGAGAGQNLSVNFTPTDSANYAGSTKTVAINVTKGLLTVTPGSVAKTYGDADPNPFPFALSGFVNGDTDTPATVPTRPVCGVTDPHVNAGIYTDKIRCSGGDAPNYTFHTTAKTTLTINQATLTVTPSPVTKTYGDADPNSFPFAIGGFRSGDPPSVVTTQPVCGVSAPHVNAGVYASAIACSGGAAGTNYVVDTAARATLTVNKATLAVTPANQTTTYGDADPAFAFVLSGFKLSDTDTPAAVPTRPVCSVATAPHVGASTYDITCSGGAAPNYDFNTTAKARLTVNKATLLITPDNKSRSYGDADPPFTFTPSGFKYSDTASSIATSPTCGINGSHDLSGTYDIVCSGGAAANYVFNTTPKGTLTVTVRVDSYQPTVAAGASVTVAWRGIRAPSVQDWVGLYHHGDADASPIARTFTDGSASGSKVFPVAANTAPGSDYEFRLFSNNTYTRLGTSSPLTVTAPPPAPSATIAASPTTVAAGGTLSVTWSGISPTTSNDIFMLYPSSTTADTAYIASRYTGGAAAGTLPLTVPANAAPGTTYELRLWSNNGAKKLATSSPLTVTAPPPAPSATIAASPTTVAAGGTLSVTWSGISPTTSNDIFMLYPSSTTADTAYIASRYTGGAAAGTLPLTVPANAAPGTTYELRLWSNNGAKKLATSSPLTVTAPPPAPSATIAASPTTVAAGGTLSVTWSGISPTTSNDIFMLYPSSTTADTAYIASRYTGGAAAGTLPLTVPANAAPGTTYELRLWSNNGAKKLATSSPLTVTAAPAPTVSGSPTTVKAGTTLTVSWSNIATPTSTDLVALYPSSSTGDTAHIAYSYTGGKTSGTLSLTVPANATPGAAYELRLWSNGGAKRLATSSPLTVSA